MVLLDLMRIELTNTTPYIIDSTGKPGIPVESSVSSGWLSVVSGSSGVGSSPVVVSSAPVSVVSDGVTVKVMLYS